MQTTSRGSEFKNTGMGNVRWSENYIVNAAITNIVRQAALRTLYTSMVNSGLDKKFSVFRLFFNGTAGADRLNVLDPYNLAAAFVGELVNDIAEAHTTTGYQPSAATGRFIRSNYTVPVNFSNMHLHAWNTTAEAAGNGVVKYLVGAASGNSGNYIGVALSRNVAGKTGGSMFLPNGMNVVQCGPNTGYDVTKTGLLSYKITDLKDQTTYDNGAVVGVNNRSSALTGLTSTNSLRMGEGGMNRDVVVNSEITDSKLFFVGYGHTIWTDADETALYNILSTFKTAIGV